MACCLTGSLGHTSLPFQSRAPACCDMFYLSFDIREQKLKKKKKMKYMKILLKVTKDTKFARAVEILMEGAGSGCLSFQQAYTGPCT